MAVLGLRGTGAFSADDRPKNYRETILLLFPNASAPLTAILSRLSNEETNDPEFKWFEKGLPSQTAVVSGSQTSGDTQIELVTAADYKKFKPGHAVLNTRTLEIVWVTAVASGVLTVIRGKGSTAASMNNLDTLLIIGSHHEEGGSTPEAVSYDPSVVSNYTQIFRTALDVTNTAKATNIRYADGQYIKEAKREALEIHSIEMERAFTWGGSVEDTSSGPQTNRTTKGLINFISTNVQDFSDSVSISTWETFLEGVFKNGSSEKLGLFGARAINVLNQLARAHYTVNAVPKDSTYGMNLTEYVTPFGSLMIKQHPLLSNISDFQDWGFILDPKNVKYRYLRGRDTQYLENRQSPGDDATKNEFLTECGLELNHESSHGVCKNMSAISA